MRRLKEPILTIIMPTYNKAKYISDALDSIFAQETQYPYQIIVADDCSTDNTLDIVRSYQKNHPGKIKILPSKINQKLYKNVIRAYKITNTKYWCVLDPDDYYTSNKKFERSLNFLESHPDYTIFGTDIEILEQDGSRHNCNFSNKITDSDWNDYLNGNAVIPFTNGTIFRNVALGNKLPKKLLNKFSQSQTRTLRGDSFRNAIEIRHGKAHYEPDVEAVYRITDTGIYQSSDMITRNILNCLLFRDLWLFFDKKYPELLLLSRSLYRKNIETAFVKQIQNIDTNKLLGICSDIADLERIYAEKAKQLDVLEWKKLSVKNKIRFFWYKKLRQKMISKGII